MVDGEWRTFICGRNDEGRRLDRVLRILLPELPLSAIYGALRRGRILLNRSRAVPERRVVEHDEIFVMPELLSGIRTHTMAPSTIRSTRNSSLQVLFKNDDILVISKPRGMLSHGPGSADDLVQALFPPSLASGLSFRPGPLHRLDRNTSGILCFSLSSIGAREGTRAFKEGLVKKLYLGLFTGCMSEPMLWEDHLERDGSMGVTKVSKQGAFARARFFPIAYEKRYSLGAVRLETGKTHQIRVQAALRGHPLVGDVKYGGAPFDGGYFLHAWGMAFALASPSFPPILKCPLPLERVEALRGIFGPAIVERAEAVLSSLLTGEDQAMGTH